MPGARSSNVPGLRLSISSSINIVSLIVFSIHVNVKFSVPPKTESIMMYPSSSPKQDTPKLVYSEFESVTNTPIAAAGSVTGTSIVAAFPFESFPSTLYVPAGTPVSVLLDVLKDWPLEIAKFNSS